MKPTRSSRTSTGFRVPTFGSAKYAPPPRFPKRCARARARRAGREGRAEPLVRAVATRDDPLVAVVGARGPRPAGGGDAPLPAAASRQSKKMMTRKTTTTNAHYTTTAARTSHIDDYLCCGVGRAACPVSMGTSWVCLGTRFSCICRPRAAHACMHRHLDGSPPARPHGSCEAREGIISNTRGSGLRRNEDEGEYKCESECEYECEDEDEDEGEDELE